MKNSTGEIPSMALVDSITSAPLVDIAQELGEVAIDSILNEGFLRDIPVIGSIAAIFKTGFAIRDRFYLRKVISFLRAVSTAPSSARIGIEGFFSSEKERKDFGETVLLLIERSDDMRKPELMGHLWSACATGHISYAVTARLCYMIDRAFWSDLVYLKGMRAGVQNEFAPIAQALSAVGFVTTTGIDGGTYDDPLSGGMSYAINQFGRDLVTHGLAKMG